MKQENKKNKKTNSNNLKSKKLGKKNVENNKKIVKICIMILLICMCIVIAIFYVLKIEKENKYSQKIKIWGFNVFYNNNSTYSWEKVSKIEAVKLILGATTNKKSIDAIYSSNNMSQNEAALYIAQFYKIIDDNKITKENMYEVATMSDIYMLINNARIKILYNSDSEVITPLFINYNDYSIEEKRYIYSMISLEFLENSEKKIDLEKKVFKRDLNKIIYEYVYKFNTISLNREKITDDEDKIPANVLDYPYILESVPKEVYEQERITQINNEYVCNPAEMFSNRKDIIASTKYHAEEFYNVLLNVDYQTIDADKMIEQLADYVIIMVNEDIVREYVEYVKKNKIKITGKATPQLPAMYNDGLQIRLRLKLEFKVESSDTNKNILCYDLVNGDEVSYPKKDNVIYIDAPLEHVIGSTKVYNNQTPIYKSLLQISKNEIKIKYNNIVTLKVGADNE